MRGASRASFIMARERLTAALEGRVAAARLGDELFAVAHLLDREPGLRRALTDATSPAAARSGLARQLLDGRVSAATRDLVAGMADGRWSSPRDLADATEQLGVLATAAAAEMTWRTSCSGSAGSSARNLVSGRPCRIPRRPPTASASCWTRC